MLHIKLRDRLLAFVLAVLAFALYAFTAAPGVATVFDDSLEFQLVLPTLGIAHPTGYPFYTLAGWFFTRIFPLGNEAYRANLFSALAAALTIAFLYRITVKIVGARLPSLVATALFAVSTVWWSQATLAEVYAFHGLFVTVLWFVALQIDENRTQDQNYRKILLLAFLFGLALTHHRMTFLLVPGLAFLVFSRVLNALRQQKTFALWALAAFLAPLGLYAYVWLRGQTIPTTAGAWLNTWPAFWEHVTARAYNAFFSSGQAGGSAFSPLSLVTEQFGAVGALLGVWGIFPWLLQWRRWAAILLAFVVQLSFAVLYQTADSIVFFLPALLMFTILVAMGLMLAQDSLLVFIAQVRQRGVLLPGGFKFYRFLAQIGLVALVIFDPLKNAWLILSAQPRAPQTCEDVFAVGVPPSVGANRRDAWATLDCARDLLSQPIEKHATLVGLLGEITLVRYFQEVENVRRDLQTVVADAEETRRSVVLNALSEGKIVYLLRPLNGLFDAANARNTRVLLDAVGPLIRARADNMRPPATVSGEVVSLSPAISALAARAWPVPAHNGRVVRIAVTWLVATPITETWQVSARLLDETGRVVAQRDAEPVHRAFPTTQWRAGDQIADVYDVSVDSSVHGALTPLLILYRASDGHEIGRVQLAPLP